MKKNMKLFKNRTIQAILLVLAGLFVGWIIFGTSEGGAG